MKNNIGNFIVQKRKEMGYTQQELARYLHVSFQAVSKWENGSTTPDIVLLPKIAQFFRTSVDALLGYSSLPETDYEKHYKQEDYYWGLNPNKLCYDIMKLKPPIKPYRVLDMGCGEGKDAVFLAKNGYSVSAFDVAESGLEKARILAKKSGVKVNFFKANILDYRPDGMFDIIFSSGVFHYITPEIRNEVISSLKEHTVVNGINVINVFVDKPFINNPPDYEMKEFENPPWHSGELFTYYHDWMFHKNDERIFDCNSGGILHKHCMDVLIAERKM